MTEKYPNWGHPRSECFDRALLSCPSSGGLFSFYFILFFPLLRLGMALATRSSSPLLPHHLPPLPCPSPPLPSFHLMAVFLRRKSSSKKKPVATAPCPPKDTPPPSLPPLFSQPPPPPQSQIEPVSPPAPPLDNPFDVDPDWAAALIRFIDQPPLQADEPETPSGKQTFSPPGTFVLMQSSIQRTSTSTSGSERWCCIGHIQQISFGCSEDAHSSRTGNRSLHSS